MNAKQHKSYTAALEAAQEKFDREVSELAEKIRKEVIIPLCKKHKLTFTSGMGTFFFSDEKGNDYHDHLHHYEGSKRIFQAVKGVLELLCEDVSHNQCLGFYVGDVK